jgi:hypothetical protein
MFFYCPYSSSLGPLALVYWHLPLEFVFNINKETFQLQIKEEKIRGLPLTFSLYLSLS